MVDTEGFEAINTAAKITKDKVENNQWKAATDYWAYTQSVVLQKTYNVDFYNILTKRNYSGLNLSSTQDIFFFDKGICKINVFFVKNFDILFIL